jgi:hypothetical protein
MATLTLYIIKQRQFCIYGCNAGKSHSAEKCIRIINCHDGSTEAIL